MPVAVDCLADLPDPATYVRCAALARPLSADALRECTHQRAVGAPYLLRRRKRPFSRFAIRAAGGGREVFAARTQLIIGLLAWLALRRRFSGDGASGCRQAGRWERTSARRPFGERRRAGPAPAGERTRCRSSDTPRPGGNRDICASIRQHSLPRHQSLRPRLARPRRRRESPTRGPDTMRHYAASPPPTLGTAW
jgi:hypothetical protein